MMSFRVLSMLPYAWAFARCLPAQTAASQPTPASSQPSFDAHTIALTVPEGTPLHMVPDREVPVRMVAEPVSGRVMQPVYVCDAFVIPFGRPRKITMREAPTLFPILAILISGSLLALAQSAASQSLPPQFVTSAATAMQGRQAKPSSHGAYTLEVDAEEVVLNCTVLNNKGQLVNDLNKSNFKAFEDKVPQAIISLQHQDTPVSIGLLVDNSGSMRAKRAAVASAAIDLVKASNPQDETFVINFSDQAYLDQDFTSNLSKLQNGLARLSMSGGTALYDTVVTAADKMERSAKRPRKALIVITDGDDNASKLTLDNAIHRVQDKQGPIIYSIGLMFDGDSGRGETRRARHDLQALSSETGGIAFFPSSLQDIDSVAAQVARDIRNQYAIAYHSARTPVNGYHTVKVEAHASGQSKLTVYTRAGYFSTLPSSSNSKTDGK
jgi:Ca-activated chloride channel family protein